MILSIYRVIEEDTGRSFYDLELNNFICALDSEQGLSNTITSIEESSYKASSLLFEDLMSLPDFYADFSRRHSTIIIASFEFLDTNDLKARLRSVIESNHPELLI